MIMLATLVGIPVTPMRLQRSMYPHSEKFHGKEEFPFFLENLPMQKEIHAMFVQDNCYGRFCMMRRAPGSHHPFRRNLNGTILPRLHNPPMINRSGTWFRLHLECSG